MHFGRVFALILSILFASNPVYCQFFKHVEPLHWWINLKNKNFQLLVHADKISEWQPQIQSKDLVLKKVNRSDNPNYLFLDIQILPSAKAGTYTFTFSRKNEKQSFNYELKQLSYPLTGAKGFGQEDVIYLIMPDRFANGNPNNDAVEGCIELPARNEPSGRHGGDLAGIEQNLPYLKDLGITALWLNPVLENNQPHYSYHGYAFTDLYKIDPRFGNLQDYKKLIKTCHNQGLKMVQDMVANHIGSKHWWMDDKPASDWFHPSGDPFKPTNFRIEAVMDPNGSKADHHQMVDGWFDTHMADLNQRNPFLANYLIQNSIWWIAETGIDGIRMDTYPYNDKEFMSRWCTAILKEFPQFGLVGEIWMEQPSFVSYFTEGTPNLDGYVGKLPSATDFPVYFGINKALVESGGWESGLNRLYITLSQDFVYKNASRNMIFLDNHDLTRFFTYQKEDFDRFNQGIALLLTLRGVPQWYYGTEILMTGDGSEHPQVRKDFPGGWPSDVVNCFETKGRVGKVDSAFNFCRKLLQWRKGSKAIQKGKFTQYLPEKNVYAYFRMFENEKVFVIVNGNEQPADLKLDRLKESLGKTKNGKDVVSGKTVDLTQPFLTLPAKGVLVLECD